MRNLDNIVEGYVVDDGGYLFYSHSNSDLLAIGVRSALEAIRKHDGNLPTDLTVIGLSEVANRLDNSIEKLSLYLKHIEKLIDEKNGIYQEKQNDIEE